MPNEELKPCPFCGDDEAPLVVVRRGKDGWRDRFLVLCDYEHGGCGGSSGWYHYEPEAVGAWNRRATAAVEPKRNKGHWVPVFFEDDFDGYVHNDLDDPAYYQCNQCGFERKSPTMFCQQCGALMFPEEDNDE